MLQHISNKLGLTQNVRELLVENKAKPCAAVANHKGTHASKLYAPQKNVALNIDLAFCGR